MIIKIKNLFFKNLNILGLVFLIIITILFSSYLNIQKKLDAQNYNDLIDNVNYLKLKDYVADLTKVIMISNEIIMEIEEIDNFENRITETKTDLLTYLENYVNDDTSHENIRDYIEKDFDDIKEFLLSLAKGYFYNNFLEYLKNIEKEVQ